MCVCRASEARAPQQPGGAQDVVSEQLAVRRRLAHVAQRAPAVLPAVAPARRAPRARARALPQPGQAAARARDAALRPQRSAVVARRAVSHYLLRRLRPDPQQTRVQPARPVVTACR